MSGNSQMVDNSDADDYVVLLEKQRDAWRAACRYLYEVIGEGNAKGRPMDLISKGDYGRIIAMIGKAESLEAE